MAEKHRIYPELPEDLKAAKPEDLAELVTSFEATMLKVRARDEETLGDLTMTEVHEQTRAAVDALKSVKAEVEARAQTEEQFDAELAKLIEDEAGVVAKAEDPEPKPEGDDPDPDPEATPEAAAEVVAEAEAATAEAAETPAETETPAEPVLASGGLRAARPRPPAPTKRDIVPEAREPVAAMVAAATGREIDSRLALAEAMIASNTPTGGSDVKTLVASVDFGPLWPENRRLGFQAESPFDIGARIQEVVGAEALTASGGLCAPVTPYYALANVSTASRPVRDALAGFNAVRGGLNFARPATLGDVAESVGIKTAAQDALGGTNALKNCLAVECPDFSTVDLEMIYRCLQFGNLNARSFPELIAQWTDLAIAYHARVAESALLDYIGSTATHVAAGPIYGSTSTIIDSILYATAGMRSRHRMDPNVRFRLLLPAWARDSVAADVVNSQFQRFDTKPGDVAGLLGSYGVEVTWYLDTETGASQVFGTQSAGALLTFPNTIIGYLYPEGSYLFLDGGTLDLGIVRDSTLNSTNDFQVFAETFEAAAFVGVEALRLALTACENGTVANPATAFSC